MKPSFGKFRSFSLHKYKLNKFMNIYHFNYAKKRANFLNGQLNGLKREWNIFGHLTSLESYKNGFKVEFKTIYSKCVILESFLILFRLAIAGI